MEGANFVSIEKGICRSDWKASEHRPFLSTLILSGGAGSSDMIAILYFLSSQQTQKQTTQKTCIKKMQQQDTATAEPVASTTNMYVMSPKKL